MKKRQLSEGYRLYLAPHEYQTLLTLAPDISVHAHPKEVELFLRLGAESGLRADEIADVTQADIVDSSNPDSPVKFLETWGKDSSGNNPDGKYRKTILTKATVACITDLLDDVHRDPDETLISVKSGTLHPWASKLSELAVDTTGKDDFQYFTPHDLRAYFATNTLVRHGMNMETIMTVGGWEDYATMKPYLSVTSDGQIIEDFQDAGLLEGTGWSEYATDDVDDGSVYARLNAATPMAAAAELSALGADQMASRVETLAGDVQDVEDGEQTIGRFTPSESQTAVRAGKYGAVVGLTAAGITGSVPSLGTSTMLPVATVAMAAPIAWGWHRSDAAD